MSSAPPPRESEQHQGNEKGEGEGSSTSPYSAHEMCEAAVDHVLQNVNTVQYLIQSIEQITQAPFSRDRIKCLPATPAALQGQGQGKGRPGQPAIPVEQAMAGYMWRRARPDCAQGDIVLIEEHVSKLVKGKSKKRDTAAAFMAAERKALEQTERNVRHELVHAFDNARGVIESADCLHQACSEIRAARLSGDCLQGQEMRKGRFDVFGGGLSCVQRRAMLAVDLNPVCKGFSDRAVQTVFKQCYEDYEPFAAPLFYLGSYGEEKFENATLRL